MGTQLEVIVDGRWLSMEMLHGVDSFSTCWPGGSDELSWTPATNPARRFAGEEDVVGIYGGVPVFAGHLLEPDASTDQLTATGAWREGDDFSALDGSGNASRTPDTAIDQAISRGLNWTRPASINASTIAIDISQGPVGVGQLLDRNGENTTVRWGVDPYRRVYAQADPTTPSFQTLPIAGGLGYALDGYASTLIGRYQPTSTTYATVTVTDPVAEALHGHVEAVVSLIDRGVISAGTATNHLTSMLALGRSTPKWTRSLEVVYGELLSMGGGKVALETVAAGDLLRVNGGYELVQRGNSNMFIDVLIGRTELSGGTLTITPLLIAPRAFTDVLAAS
jgi:hypothetical protein